MHDILLDTNRVHEFIFIHIDGMFISIDIISICIGIPKPQLRRFRVAAGLLYVYTAYQKVMLNTVLYIDHIGAY